MATPLIAPAAPGDSCWSSIGSFFGCATEPLRSIAGGVAGGVWDAIAGSFADGAVQMMKAFGAFFTHSTSINLARSGYQDTFSLCTAVAGALAVIVISLQVAVSVLRRDGAGIGRAVAGSMQAFVALGALVGVATAMLQASDEVTNAIIGDPRGYDHLQERLVVLFKASSSVGAALLLIFGLAGILLSLLLYLEMLARQAAVVLLVATSPIPIAGLMGDGTRRWFKQTATTLLMLIWLKPVVALVLHTGLSEASTASGVNGLLAACLTLLAAAIAWPVLARFLSFSHAGGGTFALAGVAVGAAAARIGAGGASSLPAAGGAAAAPGGQAGVQLARCGLAGGGAAAGGGASLAAAAGLGLLRASAGLVDRMAEHGGSSGQATYGSPWSGQNGSWATQLGRRRAQASGTATPADQSGDIS
jgi:hypothetical protein